MNVTLVSYTGQGYDDPELAAAKLLVMTKMTRLTFNEAQEVESKTLDELMPELKYMASTIPSSWEFLDVHFLVEGISRACAQQITRTRTGSYAMLSQRVTDVSRMRVYSPFEPYSDLDLEFDEYAQDAAVAYQKLIENGAKPEEARGIMPINTTCNIHCKYNFRAFCDLVRARSSHRTQSEYATVIDGMKREVLKRWSWAELFWQSKNKAAIDLLDEILAEVGMEVGNGIGWKIAKVQDLLR